VTARAPLADIVAEARQVLAACAARGVSARLIGGLAVALHEHTATPPELRRAYADIDIVIGRKEGRGAKKALTGLGYTPNDRFNALRGDRRLLFYDTANGRQLDVFVGTFAMCHTLDLSGRLALHPDTLCVADLVLTKLQIVEINTKDLVDAAQLLRNHQLGRDDEGHRRRPGEAAQDDRRRRLLRLRDDARGDGALPRRSRRGHGTVRQAHARDPRSLAGADRGAAGRHGHTVLLRAGQ